MVDLRLDLIRQAVSYHHAVHLGTQAFTINKCTGKCLKEKTRKKNWCVLTRAKAEFIFWELVTLCPGVRAKAIRSDISE